MPALWSLVLLVLLGIVGCHSWEPHGTWAPRQRISHGSRLQRRRTEASPDSISSSAASGLSVIKVPVDPSAETPGSREHAGSSDSLQNRAILTSQESTSFNERRAQIWKPGLLIRANDSLLNQAPQPEVAGTSPARFSLEPVVGDLEETGRTAITVPAWQWQPDDLPVNRETWSRWERLQADYGNFYSRESLFRLGTAFLAGAAMANTNFDEMFSHDLYRENVVDVANDDYSQKLHQPKMLGDGYILLPTLAGLALAEPWLQRSEWTRPLGEWGDRGARAMLVGGPVILLTQNLTGASRPNESPSGSHWEPFRDNNGVSGHAFVGAVPFLTAGRMSRNPWAKAAWYGASALPGLSRINDERHYFSQVFLGWYVAWLATAAVENSEQDRRQLKIMPTWSESGPGVMLEKHF